MGDDGKKEVVRGSPEAFADCIRKSCMNGGIQFGQGKSV